MIRNQLIFPLIKEICKEEQIAFLEEPSRGMFGVLKFDNGHKFFIKDVNININYVSSVRITRNKSLTSYFLEEFGYNNPEYTMVYSDDKCQKYNLSDTLEKGLEFAKNLGYPVILKINDSSKGSGVFKVYDEEELKSTALHIFGVTNTFQIQKFYKYKDYRVVVLGDKIISAYQRIPLNVIGNGKSTIKELLQIKQSYFDNVGRDTIIDMNSSDMHDVLCRQGYTLNTILPKEEMCVLRSVSNLSAGGDPVDVTHSIHDDYINLCLNIASDLNLNLCGIDIMCTDICNPLTDYIILEVNSAPGLDNYIYTGEKQIRYVKELYRKVILYIKNTLCS